jgi:tRNA (adenine57-N1/adenine58-N1)-methyltransferase
VNAVLLVHGDREYLREPGDRLETDLGVLEVPAEPEPGPIETHLGERFELRRPRLADLFDHLDRTGAPMLPRDVGLVLGLAGVGEGDRVLDAGTGTGILAIAMGRAGADVTSYERDADFAAVARENVRLAGVDGVEVRTGDLRSSLEELGRFEVITLDTEDAPTVAASAPDHLVAGGYLVAYCPFVESARETAVAAREAGLAVETRETIGREMDFDDRGTRPSTAGVGHTGYLVLARRT